MACDLSCDSKMMEEAILEQKEDSVLFSVFSLR